MFKKYKVRIKELNTENNDLKYTLTQKEEQIIRLHEECLRLRDVINAKVENCKVGPWCLTCDHYRTDTSQKVWGAVVNANSNIWAREVDDKDGTVMCRNMGNANITINKNEAHLILNALEKQIPKKIKHIKIEHGKHTWQRDENGKIDEWDWESGFHNGVACVKCYKTVCVCCNPDYDNLEDCVEEKWNCPVCGNHCSYYNKPEYCTCGQKLDWNI